MREIRREFDKLLAKAISTDEYQEYITLQDKIMQDTEIMQLIDKIKQLQKQIVHKKARNQPYLELDQEIEKNLERLQQIPIYVRYDELQEELNFLFQKIRRELENYLYHITNE